MGQRLSKIILTLTATLIIAACSREVPPSPTQPKSQTFVGSEQCASCHSGQFELWQGSHHQLAMQAADSNSVLGDFSDVSVKYFDTETRFFTRDGKHFVETQNSTGDAEEFEITHTFGVTPLQQYLVDGPKGRKQALQFAWDAREKSAGGQRWYHLYPDEYIGPNDPLHWTGRYFNWNYMCAECHSTNVELGYDLGSDTFATTYDEISVGCEACHGPGSQHVNQANLESFDESLGLPFGFDDRKKTTWVMNASTGIAERTAPNLKKQETESCGRCHARRGVVANKYEYGTPLTNTHMVSLLEENLYHADGRIQDEVYVYGSFVQSKMYAADVTCSDCHNPHSGKLHAGPDPNKTCSTCHLTSKFASTDHNSEKVGDCVACHMPATTYMGVDDRRDHSFRLPGTADDPNHYGDVIAAGRMGNANDRLLQGVANELTPPIARATMLTLLEPIADAGDQARLLLQLDNPNPLIRIGALRALRNQPPEVRASTGSHLLRDPVRSVRIEAALTYVEYRDLLPLEGSRAFPDAAEDYRSAITAAAAMPGPALNLAEFERSLGNTAAAARMYEHAIKVGADSAPVQHAYGLHLVRTGNSSAALEHLKRAVELAPAEPQFVYVYGVALNSLGEPSDAVDVLGNAYEQFPENFDIGWALATMHRDTGDRESALKIAKQLEDNFPNEELLDTLIRSLVE